MEQHGTTNDPAPTGTAMERERLPAYLEETAAVEGDVVQVSEEVWAVHGLWPYEGEVILAEYTSFATARMVIQAPSDGSTDAPAGRPLDPGDGR
jgi:hypothetical protein